MKDSKKSQRKIDSTIILRLLTLKRNGLGKNEFLVFFKKLGVKKELLDLEENILQILWFYKPKE